MVVRKWIALGLTSALVACSKTPPADRAHAEVTDASALAAVTVPTPSASASAAPSAVASGIVLLPKAPPNPAPLHDCHPKDPGDPFGCCTGDGFADIERMARNREPAECRRIAKLPKYGECPTFFSRGFHAVVEQCLTDAMNRELDRRLLPLKTADPVAFRREMELQKHFNEAVTATRDAIMLHEPSTGDFHDSFGAVAALIELRTRQAASANVGGLAISRAPAGATAAPKFKAFAHALCITPAMWKDQSPPSECEARVRGELQDTISRAMSP